MNQPYIVVPTYDNGLWTTTSFNTREEYRDFVKSLFKEPGKYEFNQTSFIFNEQARNFHSQGYFCKSPFKSKDFIEYWDDQKNKCRKGVIYHSLGKTWYLTRDYYMWLNFLPIFDKEEKKFDFAKVRDAQYHMALYEFLAEYHWHHSAVLKKRQIASSYFHAAKLLNMYWFEEGAILKMGASMKSYINESGTWKMLMEYRNFLNEHTAWYRPNEPDKIFSWQQRIKVRIGGRDKYVGLRSILTGTSFEKDATAGVGGPCTYFFHEEAGIAPKMGDTFEFMRPAMQSGHMTTGMFIAAGSVGDLDQCQPLKDMILNPKAKQIYAVPCNVIDDKGTVADCGLFIPEQWSMPPYIDEFGNSLVDVALEAIYAQRLIWKEELTPEDYQLRISQHPTTIQEAFATRKEPIFPSHLINDQLARIENGKFPVEYMEIGRNGKDEPILKATNRQPIKEFPITKKTEDKRGAICVYERPMKDAPWGTYIASIDPVSEGKTTTSESLCSIIIYKTQIELTRIDQNGNKKVEIERDKIVLTWCGRYDDINDTHALLLGIIQIYNAWTLCENNISLFIQYMILHNMQKYLIPKDQIMFLKELKANMNVFADYGWKNTGNMFKTTLLSYGIEFMKEKIDMNYDVDGEAIDITFGVERIPDPMILIEANEYQHGMNVDRLVSYCALVAFVQIMLANVGMRRRVEVREDQLDNSQKMTKLNRSPFKHLGTSTSNIKRNPFKNLR